MRWIGWPVLLGLVLLGGPWFVSSSVAGGKPGPRGADRADKSIVDGYGPTENAARERALEHAQERIEELLHQRYRNADLRLTTELLDPEYLARLGVLTPEGEPGPATQIAGERVLVARYRVTLTSEYLEAVKQHARHERVVVRHVLAGRVLAGLLALCLVMAGYLRLEEWTRGYATRFLQLIGLVLLGVAVAGLLLLG